MNDKTPLSLDDLDLDDPRTDARRASNAALGRSAAAAAAELIAEGSDPRAVVVAFMSAGIGISLRHLGIAVTADWLGGMAEEVAALPDGAGSGGRA